MELLGGNSHDPTEPGVGVEDRLSGGFVDEDGDGAIHEDAAGVEGEVLHEGTAIWAA